MHPGRLESRRYNQCNSPGAFLQCRNWPGSNYASVTHELDRINPFQHQHTIIIEPIEADLSVAFTDPVIIGEQQEFTRSQSPNIEFRFLFCVIKSSLAQICLCLNFQQELRTYQLCLDQCIDRFDVPEPLPMRLCHGLPVIDIADEYSSSFDIFKASTQ